MVLIDEEEEDEDEEGESLLGPEDDLDQDGLDDVTGEDPLVRGDPLAELINDPFGSDPLLGDPGDPDNPDGDEQGDTFP